MPRTKKRLKLPASAGVLRTVAFVRSSHRHPDGVETLALLQVRTPITSREELASRLREAVHTWTMTTELGRRVRTASSADTNIGDMASYGVFEESRDPELDRLLAVHHLHDVRLLAVFDDGPTLPYDMLLIKSEADAN
jgi:hypothetical protein